jgi:excisionase family DNA binding protein
MSDFKALPEVLTADEVASYLRVSKTTICRWCKDGKLRAFRIGRGWRVQRSDLEDHIRRAVLVPTDLMESSQFLDQ